MKTRSAYVKAPWQFEIRSIDLPDVPPSGHVLVRVEACGVCGTDVTDAAEKAHQWHPFGHEVAGVVERVGAGVEHLKA
ncbi:MAG TPA: alcohol dehydrogenase catalytic domain-containing protein, partial [Phycisphaerae bacterium]|nr:alcohol dehydrogenase catalytic domain-containing protein [Phycisphaerae bacterium]